MHLPYDTTILIKSIYPWELKIYWYTDLYTHVHSSFIYNSELKGPSTAEWINKLVQPHNAILLNNKKGTTDTCNNINISKARCSSGKPRRLHMITFIWNSSNGNDQNQIWLPVDRVGAGDWLQREMKNFQAVRMFYIKILVVAITWLYTFDKIHKIIHSNWPILLYIQ